MSYQSVADETGALEVRVPESWGNVRGSGWFPTSFGSFDGARVGPGLNAAPNVSSWFKDLTTPGVFFGASSIVARTFTPESAARAAAPSDCRSSTSGSYRDARYTGRFLRLTCPNTQTRWYALAAWPEDHSYLVYLQVKLVTPADREALHEILASFRVTKAP